MGVPGWKKINAQLEPKLMSKTITANGFYDAGDDDHVDGYSSLEVAVPGGGGGGPFTVRFFADDGQTILKTDANVPYGGSASCTLLDGTVVGGQYFKGWNPAPTNVKEDINCYPVRGDYIIDAGEIADSWETICADGGAHYPFGSYKGVQLIVPAATRVFTRANSDGTMFDYSVTIPNATQQIKMIKVAEGEDGSNSTWLSEPFMLFNGDYVRDLSKNFNDYVRNNSGGSIKMWSDWANSALKELLNNEILALMPYPLPDRIREVTKVQKGLINYYQGSNPQNVERESLDKIWVPSIKELWSKVQNFGAANGLSSVSTYKESRGIDYVEPYTAGFPGFSTWSADTITRTAGYNGGYVDGMFMAIRNTSIAGWYYTSHYLQIGFCL
jgi:hypothetical protein